MEASTIENDIATEDVEDLFDKEYKEEIVSFIQNCETPFSIALSGRWGSGKTSIMKSIKKDIKKDNENTKTICFNPWENEEHPEPIVPLLQAIIKQVSMFSKAKEKGIKLTNVLIHSALGAFKSIIDLSSVQKNGEKYEYDNFQYIHRQDRLNDMFKKAVILLLCAENSKFDMEELKPQENSKLIIFIDDLDRCEDSTIIKLLSSIKQHLSTKYCLFIFGYDRSHVEKSLSKSLKKTQKESKVYLEKMFQKIFYIKPPTIGQIESFLGEKIHLPIEEDKDLLTHIGKFMSHNPREIKNFIRAFNFEIKTKDDLEAKGVALIVYLKTFYENVYVVLLNTPSTIHDLLSVFKDKDIEKSSNHTEYLFYLELHSFINKVAIEPSTKPIPNDEFLEQVYSMQGKHMQFQNYIEEFGKFFNCTTNEKTNEKTNKEKDEDKKNTENKIKKYL